VCYGADRRPDPVPIHSLDVLGSWLRDRQFHLIEWFDDLKLGMRFKSGEVSVTKEDIKRFAAEFDPQPEVSL
jgi:hypothetical protein